MPLYSLCSHSTLQFLAGDLAPPPVVAQEKFKHLGPGFPMTRPPWARLSGDPHTQTIAQSPGMHELRLLPDERVLCFQD